MGYLLWQIGIFSIGILYAVFAVIFTFRRKKK
jgi:hypothetical protein